MSYRSLHKAMSFGLVLFVCTLAAMCTREVLAQEPAAAPTCKTAIVIWVPIQGAEFPLLLADKEYADRETCIINKAQRESAAAILEFRATAAGIMPASRCIGVRETLAAEGVEPGHLIMSAAAINEAYGEEICPPDPAAPEPGVPVSGS